MGCFHLPVSETHVNLLSQRGNLHSRGSGLMVTVLLSLVCGLPPHGQGRWPSADPRSLPPGGEREGSLGEAWWAGSSSAEWSEGRAVREDRDCLQSSDLLPGAPVARSGNSDK